MSEVSYLPTSARVTESDLTPFFVGWPDPPSGPRRLEILRSADEVIIARDAEGSLVGFVTALTDGVFAAYLPLLEVAPTAQGRGIGTELVRRMLHRLRECYMIDLVCDEEIVTFYERFGGTRLNAVTWRHPDRLAD